jgi:hypothetical protein
VASIKLLHNLKRTNNVSNTPTTTSAQQTTYIIDENSDLNTKNHTKKFQSQKNKSNKKAKPSVFLIADKKHSLKPSF